MPDLITEENKEIAVIHDTISEQLKKLTEIYNASDTRLDTSTL